MTNQDFIRNREKGSPPEGEVTNEDFIRQMTVGTPLSNQEADPDVLKDIVRGSQYTPFDLLGGPVDIATMAMRPFGYNVEKPVGGSDYFIDQAAKLGLFNPSTGSAAEFLGRIGGGGATPAIARGITKAADATGDFISGQLKSRADSRAVQQAASKVPPDTAYDPLRDRMEQIGALTYAVKPTPAPIVQAPKNQMGFYSAVEDTILNLPQEKGTAQQFLAQISKAPGVKSDEIKYTGLDDFLKGKKSVTKTEIQDYLNANKVDVQEVRLGENIADDPIGMAKRKEVFDKYQPEIDALDAEYSAFNKNLDNQIMTARDKFADAHAKLNTQNYMPTGQDYAAYDLAQKELEQLRSTPRNMGDFQRKGAALRDARDAEANLAYTIPESRPTKFSKYTLPGGENYREILLTLPTSGSGGKRVRVFTQDGTSAVQVMSDADIQRMAESGRRTFEVLDEVNPQGTFQSTHFDQPNILAHLRVNDRTIDGKKTLFIEEIQSDLHQAGRKKGYATGEKAELPEGTKVFEPGAVDSPGQTNQAFTVQIPKSVNGRNLFYGTTREEALANAQSFIAQPSLGAVPDAPFKTTWHELTLKRAIQEASEKGYDQIAFTTGKTQVDRYDLSKQINSIAVPSILANNRSVRINAPSESLKMMVDNDGIVTGYYSATQFTGKSLDEVVGKEMAEKIMSATEPKDFSGLDLQVGGEGMKGFYDNILPKSLEKLGKKFDAKVGKTQMDGVEVWQMDITPKMREAVQTKGLPQFAKGGEVSTKDFIRSHA